MGLICGFLCHTFVVTIKPRFGVVITKVCHKNQYTVSPIYIDKYRLYYSESLFESKSSKSISWYMSWSLSELSSDGWFSQSLQLHNSVHVNSSFLQEHLLFLQPVLQLQLALSRMLSIAGKHDNHLTLRSPLPSNCQPWSQKSGALMLGLKHRCQMYET